MTVRHSHEADNIVDMRTATTSKLWGMRVQHAQGSEAPRPDFLIERTPADSHVRISIPLASSGAVRNSYVSFDGGLRMGVIMEDLDAFAGTVAHKHADDHRPETAPVSLVTIACDRIDMMRPLDFSDDVALDGCVTWVGRSSLEITVRMISAADDADVIMRATFLMAARFQNRAASVNPLAPTNEAERALFELGQRAQERRKEEARVSLRLAGPRGDETRYLHRMFLLNERVERGDVVDEVGPTLPMQATRLESVVLTQPQQKNTGNKIFGGYLMRRAYELAISNAYIFNACDEKPVFLGVDDILFVLPVEIGSIVKFTSHVVFAGAPDSANAFQIQVETNVIDPRSGNQQLCNIFHFTFGTPTQERPRLVLPSTYTEGLWLLDGRRRLREQRSHAVGGEMFAYYDDGEGGEPDSEPEPESVSDK